MRRPSIAGYEYHFGATTILETPRLSARKRTDPIKTVADLINERNALQRALYNLTGANKQLVELADLCSRLNWNDAPNSMMLIRRSVFGDRYDGLPLCALESAAAFRHPNSVFMITGYRVFAEAIRDQLEDLRRQRDAREADARRPEWLKR